MLYVCIIVKCPQSIPFYSVIADVKTTAMATYTVNHKNVTFYF